MSRKISLGLVVLCVVASEPSFGIEGDDFPRMDQYEKSVSAGKLEDEQFRAVLKDYIEVTKFCRTVHNDYERHSKDAEKWRLGVGVSGGVLGVTGALLVAAGTGGMAAGVAAGLAGVASTTLGSAKDGPLDTSFYASQRVLVAKAINVAAAKVEGAQTPLAIYKATVTLSAICTTPSPTSS